MLYPPELHNKFGVPWQGPTLIIDKLGDVTYVVQREQFGRKIKVHVDHIKIYDHDDVPTSWLNNDKYTQTGAY